MYGWLFWALLLSFELFLCTLPLFPNGDGPVHVYLSSILWKLATHSSPLYEHYYAIRHLIQPYSFHYYLLILLEHGMSVDAAEKVFVGLIWATLAFGFRALAQALAPTPDSAAQATTLLVFPLLLSWPMSAGFFNFTFGVGLLLFALALYTRLAEPGRQKHHFFGLVVTMVLLILAHPIPIMLFICFVGLDLAFQLFAGWQKRRTLRLPGWQVSALGLACFAFLFPILIADKAAVASAMSHMYPHLHLLLPLLLGISVSYFQVHSIFGWIYEAAIVCVLPFSVLLSVHSGLLLRLRQGALHAADRLLLGVVLFLAATIVLPEEMNGSAYFSVRMWYVFWLLAAVCIAAAVRSTRLQRAVAVFATAIAVLCLIFGLLYIRPVARQQFALEHAPIPSHARGLFLQPLNGISGIATHSWWALAFWDGARAFAAHDDVLLNTPWLQLTIVPVGENGRSGLMRDVTPNDYSESPSYLLQHFQKSPDREARALQLADFLLLADPNSATPDPLGFAATLLGPAESQWRCEKHDFYAICTRR